jgi:hypothetical protein
MKIWKINSLIIIIMMIIYILNIKEIIKIILSSLHFKNNNIKTIINKIYIIKTRNNMSMNKFRRFKK